MQKKYLARSIFYVSFWKITAFAFSVPIFIIQSRQNWESVDNALCSLVAERDISIRSSAYNRQLKKEPFGNTIG